MSGFKCLDVTFRESNVGVQVSGSQIWELGLQADIGCPVPMQFSVVPFALHLVVMSAFAGHTTQRDVQRVQVR